MQETEFCTTILWFRKAEPCLSVAKKSQKRMFELRNRTMETHPPHIDYWERGKC